MNKWLVIILLAITWYVADFALDEHTAQINDLQTQVQQLNNELTAVKHEQILNNAVTEDLSNRVGWR